MRQNRAFTLTELLIALAILSALLLLVAVVANQTRGAARTSACAASMRQLSIALSSYAADNDSTYPPAVSAEMHAQETEDDATWLSLLQPYVGQETIPRCSLPAGRDFERFTSRGYLLTITGFAYNLRLNHLIIQSKDAHNWSGGEDSAVRYPALVVTIFDARPGILAIDAPDARPNLDYDKAIFSRELEKQITVASPGATRHQGGANYSFADGHVMWLKPSQLSTSAQCDGVRPGFGL